MLPKTFRPYIASSELRLDQISEPVAEEWLRAILWAGVALRVEAMSKGSRLTL